MSKTPTCQSCRHAELTMFDPCDHEEVGVLAYECRRFPPTVFVGDEETGAVQAWPTMQPEDWCGEWEART